jgi:hypothetical protein
MDRHLLAHADEIVASLSPAKQEMVREIVINSVHRGHVDESARRYLTAASGNSDLADILSSALCTSGTDNTLAGPIATPSLEASTAPPEQRD